MFANILTQYFDAGGPVMWPLLLAGIVAVGVVAERAYWWWQESKKRDPKTVEKVFTALEDGDFAEASKLSADSRDPVLRTIWQGLNHQHASQPGALSVASGAELQKASRFLVVMDTLVTLAPLLGLLGTVSGIFGTLMAVGTQNLEGKMASITGGIGSALIPTICGLAISAFALVPFKLFSRKVAQLQFELEAASTSVTVLISAACQRVAESHALRHQN